MAKYLVYGLVYGTKHFGVIEANSPDEAIEIAQASEDNHVSVCCRCSKEFELRDNVCDTFEVEEIRED